VRHAVYGRKKDVLKRHAIFAESAKNGGAGGVGHHVGIAEVAAFLASSDSSFITEFIDDGLTQA
jgi:hypothetical protein